MDRQLSRRKCIQMFAGGGAVHLAESLNYQSNTANIETQTQQVENSPWSGSITPLAANQKKALFEVTVGKNVITRQPTVDNPVLRSNEPLELQLSNEKTRISRAFPLPSKNGDVIEMAINVGTIALGVAGAAASGGTAIAAFATMSGFFIDSYELVEKLVKQNEINRKDINILEFRDMDSGRDTFLVELERIDQNNSINEWGIDLKYNAFRDYRGNLSDDKLSLVADSVRTQACGGKNKQNGTTPTPTQSDENTQVTVSGQILKPDGEPAANNTVVVYSDSTGERATATHTDSEGRYEYEVTGNIPYRVSYYQVLDGDLETNQWEHERTAGPTDGSPDVYAVRSINEPEQFDSETTQLPQAYKLEIKVVDTAGSPVTRQEISVAHWSTDGWYAAYDSYTNRDGLLELGSRADDTGIEVHGDVSVFVGEKERNIYVDEPKSIEITI